MSKKLNKIEINMDSDWRKDFKLSWEWNEFDCSNEVVFTWDLHSKLLWSWWATCFHANWGVRDIGNPSSISDISSIIQSLLKRMIRSRDTFDLDARYIGYNNSLEVLITEFNDIRDNIKDAK